MKKVIKYLVLFLIFVLPFTVYAKDNINKNYVDKVYKIVNNDKSDNVVTLYLFHSKNCPHCKKEVEFLNSIKDKYKNLDIKMYEVSDKKNHKYMEKVKEIFNVKSNGVPFCVIGDKYFLGYSDIVSEKIELQLQDYLNLNVKTEKEKSSFKIPLLGKIDVKDFSISVIAIVLGLVDGFNPCAMWILLFLINMLFNMKNKKRMFILGYSFLFTSALVYFLSMLGINIFLDQIPTFILQKVIAFVALIVGILNIRSYLKNRKEDGCHVVDDKKRKKIFKKIQKFTTEKSLFLALIGVILLAVSVNLVELACSLGFPTTFIEILSLNKVNGVLRIVYLLVYVLMYMIDDIIVFTIAVFTLNISTRSTKYTKIVNLIAGIIMILMGILLIIKPEWIMFNF